MKSGFTFKGRHSDRYGAVVKTRSRPVRPEVKASIAEAFAADGSYNFSDANPYGRFFYSDRIFELELRIGADSLRELELKVSKAARWLMGKGELVFDDMPAVKWDAAALSEIGFTPELTGRKAVMTAVFRVKPFSRCVFDTMHGIVIGTDCMLQSPIPLDVKECFTFECEPGMINRFTVDNIGTWYVRPVIRIVSQGALGNVAISINSGLMKISGLNASELVVDCEKQTVTDGSGNNLIGYTEGDFFEMFDNAPSEMSVITNENAVVTVEYEPMCVYNFDFTEWGVYDA